MTPELWQRLKALYYAALEMADGARTQFVAEACGDDELKEELAALLKANAEQTGSDNTTPVVNLRKLFPTEAKSFVAGELILGRFRIVRHLGSGGMGEVYEAIDLQLGRVALKTIRPGMAASWEHLSRFKKEVKLARKVSSPHVCRIHELHLKPGTAEESQNAFLTMEFLDGTTLADRIREQGPLPWREAQTVAMELCWGLQCIHEAGVIHRDIKGRNIMLARRDGKACTVLMDFGIARQLSQHTGDSSTDLTQGGAIVGTPEYMAPEQFEGKEVSPATDIYALGIIFHEALTGKHPFPKESARENVAVRAHIPTRASTIQLEVPRRFDGIIAKCLEYDPKRRYQSAPELAEAIRGRSLLSLLHQRPLLAAAWAICLVAMLLSLLLIPAIGDRVRGMLLSSKEKHIAVLPFDVVGGNQETQALGDGLMDALAGRLSNLGSENKALWVVPANEVRARKVSDPSSALREFGATIVIKGSFERNDEAAHLKLILIDPKATREIGFVDVETQNGDLAALQNEAVTRLGRLMNVTVRDDQERGSSEPATRAAYEDYLAGIGYFQRHDKPGNIELAITALKSAIKTDPRFALAFAHLAEVYIMKYRLESDPKSLQQAETYAKRAAELDNQVPSTYVALGQVHELTGNHDLAIVEFQRAINLDPRDAEAVSGLANAYENAGRISDAEGEYIKAASLRPEDWTGYNNLGNFYESKGRPREAIVQFNRALQLTPDNAWPYANLGMAYMDLDDPKMSQEAETALKKSIAITPNIGAYSTLGVLYTERHQFRESVAANRAALKLNDQSYDIWSNLTVAYEWLRDDANADATRGKTIELLKRAIKLNPQNAEAQATLAALYAKNGFREKAIDGIHISLALSPDSQYVLSQAADTYELLGNRKQAIECLQQALAHGLGRTQLNGDPEIQGVVSDPMFRMHGK
jgi:serine/threonine protein kinase/tetratricopeptide (TPR) repeat protein